MAEKIRIDCVTGFGWAMAAPKETWPGAVGSLTVSAGDRVTRVFISRDDARALGQRLIELAGGAAPGEPPR